MIKTTSVEVPVIVTVNLAIEVLIVEATATCTYDFSIDS